MGSPRVAEIAAVFNDTRQNQPTESRQLEFVPLEAWIEHILPEPKERRQE